MDKRDLESSYYKTLQETRESDLRTIKNLDKAAFFETLEEAESSEVTILSRFIIIVAIIGDLFGLIPLVGNFLGLFFAVILMMLYFLNGLGKGFVARKYRKALRRWLLRGMLYSVEIFIPLASFLPLFTIEALIDYNLSKKGYYKKIEKASEIINKVK